MPISIIQELEEHTGIMNVNFKGAQIVYDLLSPQAWKCNTRVQLQNVRICVKTKRMRSGLGVLHQPLPFSKRQ